MAWLKNFGRVVVLAVLLAAGCGGVGLAPLEGTVTLDEKPLAGATVTLQRTDGPIDQRIFIAETDATGHYAAKPSWSGGAGVIPGTYQVFIQSVQLPSDANEMIEIPPDPVPRMYRDGSQVLEVPAEGLASADFHMRSQGRGTRGRQ